MFLDSYHLYSPPLKRQEEIHRSSRNVLLQQDSESQILAELRASVAATG